MPAAVNLISSRPAKLSRQWFLLGKMYSAKWAEKLPTAAQPACQLVKWRNACDDQLKKKRSLPQENHSIWSLNLVTTLQIWEGRYKPPAEITKRNHRKTSEHSRVILVRHILSHSDIISFYPALHGNAYPQIWLLS